MAAPKTVLTYPLDGANKDFIIPFEYLARKFVSVTLLGKTRQTLTLNSDYRFTARTGITTTKAWGAGDLFESIEIRRITSATERLVDFSDGSILRAYDLNTSQIQSLHIAEEARDLTADTIAINNDGNLDARGRRIVNVADGVSAGDVVTVRQMDNWDGSAKVSAERAKLSELAAGTSERLAKASELSAKKAELNANVSAGNSKSSESSASASADAAGEFSVTATKAALDAISAKKSAKQLSDRFLKPASEHPLNRDDGTPLQVGDRYLNTVVPGLEFVFKGNMWESNNLDMTTLASAQGALQVGWRSSSPGSVHESIAAAMERVVNVEKYGAKGDNVTNDVNAFKRAAEDVGRQGGGVIRLTPGKKYYVGVGGIILPEFVQFDLSGCVVRGDRIHSKGLAIFITGYFDASGVLVHNLNSAKETRMVDGVRVYNGKIVDVEKGMFFRNANMTCSIYDITFYNYAQAWRMERCFCMRFSNVFASGSWDKTVPTFMFFEAINSTTLAQVRTVSEFGFCFDAGTEGVGDVVLDNCDFEGGSMGFYFSGQSYSITFIGGYFEAVPGVLFNFSDVILCSVHWYNPYCFLIDEVIREPIRPEARITGRWVGRPAMTAGYPVEGHTYTNIYNHNHPRNSIVYDFDAEEDFFGFADNYKGGVSSAFRRESAHLNPQGTALVRRVNINSGMHPVTLSGDVGGVEPNKIGMATHQAFQPGSAQVIILVDTKIKWRPQTLRATYMLAVADANGAYRLYGDIYGDQVSKRDSVGKNIEVSEANGMLRLTLYGFTHPQGSYQCSGVVQILL